MDITTGHGLVQAIAEELDRADLIEVIPSWVRMAETNFANTLRVREMVKRSTTTATDGFIPLPEDFREMKSVLINSDSGVPYRLSLKSEDSITSARARGVWSTFPKYFTLIGNEMAIAPFKPGSSVSVEMTYFGDIPALDCETEGATTWLLKKAPTLYFYSALVYSAPYLEEDPRAALYTAAAAAAVETLNAEYKRGMAAGSSITENLPKSFG